MGRRVFVGTVPGGIGGLNIRQGIIESAEVNGNLTLLPNGTGEVVISSPVQIPASKALKFFDSDSSNFVALKAASSVSSDLTFNLPAADGTDGHVLKTNGAGTLAFSETTFPITSEADSGTTFYPSLTSATTGSVAGLTVSSTKLTYVPSTGTLTATALAASSISSTGDISADGTASSTVYSFGTEYSNGNSGTSATIDWNNGQKQTITMTGNCTFTFTAPPGVGSFLLRLVQDATGNRTANWPASVHWSDNIKPTLTTAGNRVDIVTFYYNGSIYYGQAGLDFRQV